MEQQDEILNIKMHLGGGGGLMLLHDAVGRGRGRGGCCPKNSPDSSHEAKSNKECFGTQINGNESTLEWSL